MSLKHAGKLLFCLKLLALHLTQRIAVNRQHTQLGVEHLFVEVSVPVVELAKFSIPLHQVVDFRLLTFKHRTSSGVGTRRTL
jgi:hypothetical protein